MRFHRGRSAPIPGASLMEQSEYLARAQAATCWAWPSTSRGGPRRHVRGDPDRSGDTPGADVGVLFIEPLGPVHMCGHGAIALGARWLVETGPGWPPPGGVRHRERSDTPAGAGPPAAFASEPGRPTSVTIRNVARVLGGARSPRGGAGTRVAWGSDLALRGGTSTRWWKPRRAASPSSRKRRRAWVEVGRGGSVSPSRARVPLIHPAMPEAARGCSTSSSTSRRGGPNAPAAQRGWWWRPAGLDRSPCGTGTSARGSPTSHARRPARGWGEAIRPRVHHRHALHRTDRGAHRRGRGAHGGGFPRSRDGAWMTARATPVPRPDRSVPGVVSCSSSASRGTRFLLTLRPVVWCPSGG